MMTLSSVNQGFFYLIILTGVITTVTDLCHQKIRNNHLIIITAAAVVLTIVKGFSDRSLPMLQLLSTGCAIIIGWVFYKNNLWRGGDAKLFILYSFLMPATGYESRIFFPSIVLFANTNIIGLIFFSLLLLKDLLANPKFFIENILKNLDLKRIINIALMTLYISWIILPLFYACGLTKYGVLSFFSVYIIAFSLRHKLRILIYNKLFVITAFVWGLFFRYKFSPGFFLWRNLLFYLSTVIIYSTFSLVLYRVTRSIAKSNERIPFSPFLFLGCLSSYTPFLWRVMSLQHWGK